MIGDHTQFDWDRAARTGVPETVLAEGKTVAQVREIAEAALSRTEPLLVTRLATERATALADLGGDYDSVSRTLVFGAPSIPAAAPGVAIVAAGTSDLPVAREACRAAAFFGLNTRLFADCGVAGLWRLEKILPDLAPFPVIIAVAGMEGALFPVLAGLVPQPVLAVPSSVGYGVGTGGQAALTSALASCAPGLAVFNIDNGFGAAAFARKMLNRQPVNRG